MKSELAAALNADSHSTLANVALIMHVKPKTANNEITPQATDSITQFINQLDKTCAQCEANVRAVVVAETSSLPKAYRNARIPADQATKYNGQRLSEINTERVRVVDAIAAAPLLIHVFENAGRHKKSIHSYLAGRSENFLYAAKDVFKAAVSLANPQTAVATLDADCGVSPAAIDALAGEYAKLNHNTGGERFAVGARYASVRDLDRIRRGDLCENDQDLSLVLNGTTDRVVQLSPLGGNRDKISDSPAGQVDMDVSLMGKFLAAVGQISYDALELIPAGALFAPSEATWDRPPHSQLSRNDMHPDDGMYIDGHFDHDSAANVRILSHIVTQDRRPERDGQPPMIRIDDLRWHTTTYMPRHLRGAVGQALHASDPLGTLAVRGGELTGREHQDMWEIACERVWKYVEFCKQFDGTFMYAATVGDPLLRAHGFLPYGDGLEPAAKSLPSGFPREAIAETLAADIANLINELLIWATDYREFWLDCFRPAVIDEAGYCHWLRPHESTVPV